MTLTIETNDKPERILIEDDEETMREIITHMLTTAGYECRVAETPTKNPRNPRFRRKNRSGLLWRERSGRMTASSFKSMIGKTASRTVPAIIRGRRLLKYL
jgi:DNA-binding NtrC family response regulator